MPKSRESEDTDLTGCPSKEKKHIAIYCKGWWDGIQKFKESKHLPVDREKLIKDIDHHFRTDWWSDELMKYDDSKIADFIITYLNGEGK